MKTKNEYQPKTGIPCSCKPGQQRDNCPQCEGTGQQIDFAAIRAKNTENESINLATPNQQKRGFILRPSAPIEKPTFGDPHPLANGISAIYHPHAKTKYTTWHRKENNGFAAEYSALFPTGHQEMDQPVVLRLYWTASTCYACLWVNGREKDIHTQGSGKAGGGGHCKASAAAAYAITNAGFSLSQDIDGRGTEKIKDAVLAIAHVLGYSQARVHYSHA